MLVRRLLQVGVLTKDTLRYPARHASTKGWCCSQLPLAFGRVTAGFGSLSGTVTQAEWDEFATSRNNCPNGSASVIAGRGRLVGEVKALPWAMPGRDCA
jgi:hypothetical protein